MNLEIKAKFMAFHEQNPTVYVLFDKFAKDAVRRGHKRMSADMLMHRVRWETQIVTSDDTFKLNNNWTAHYARLWMQNNPEHFEFFETRHKRIGHDVEDLVQPEMF